MKVSNSFKTNLIYIAALLHIVLFTYAAISKLLDFQNFQIQLGQSPLLSVYASVISLAVPAVELVLVIFLMIPKYRVMAIYDSCFLMFLFTVYIILILNFTSFVPCSCGGVLEKLGWKEHLVFNMAFVLLGLIVITLHKGIIHLLKMTAIGGLLGTSLMVGLFLSSEDIMLKENPFIRRFPQGTAAQVAQLDLRNTDYYIAGVTAEHIYLGNHKAQLQIFIIDKNLKNRRQFGVKLERENFNFTHITLRVHGKYFYAFDGTAGVVYRGSTSDWKAKVINDKKYAFNDIAFIDVDDVIIRGQKPKDHTNILAKVTGKESMQFVINDKLLEKQIDGFFDTDGTLNYSFDYDRMIYVYHYRNQYIVADKNLKLLHRGNTIDTTTKARIKIATIQKSGDTKLAAPPYLVNKLSGVTSNLLLVNSMLRGKFENKKVWDNATVIDVYDFTSYQYLLSFYVHDYNGFRMKDLYATHDAAYIISGPYLLKYGYGERIKSKMRYEELPAGNR
ncbi:hypothetical protein EZL74_09480 [Flavobacterium silvisoli]|uniref:Methylamine utilisation protein MauE domain-containing protein n=1 Tax=Flavobacterium silvisoli TaxID=2529433 RepID=A0A4Q9YUY3_9FLAO|nr:MauE/DoxX family redox-associated membrane protein [Flavobacterium silvisoli]TBX67492.1 hypothetical protein EZL74_09480 [Flavobacterium silvisoli]